MTIDNSDIILSSMRKKESGYEMTLFNTSREENDAEVVLHSKQKKWRLHFGKYEIKMVEV